MKNCILKRIYIILPIVFLGIYLVASKTIESFCDIDFEIIANVSVSFIASLITFIGIMLALSDKNRIIAYIKHYNAHYRILSFALFASMVAFAITIMLDAFNIFKVLVPYLFLFGIAEIFVIIHYLYYFLKEKFK